MYQVMIRRLLNGPWELFDSATTDPFAAMQQLQHAKARHADATVLQAVSASELELLVQRMRQSDQVCPPVLKGPDDLPAPNPARLQVPEERRRWELEKGPGGDHDVPYRFEMPASMQIALAWLRLMAQLRSQGAIEQAA